LQQHGLDDTAANFIKFECSVADETVSSEELAVDPNHGLHGDFGHWSDTCARGIYLRPTYVKSPSLNNTCKLVNVRTI